MNVKSSTEAKKHYQLNLLDERGGYELTAESFVWHPDPAVCRMWQQQWQESQERK